MKIYVPPIKIQGIKTKLVPIIKSNVKINANTIWIEPFMGSGVVGFNIAPKNAIFSDTNPYTIDFYNKIKNKEITSCEIRNFLENEGRKLSEGDDKYYYEVRDRFNKTHNPLDFLFLNRSCFNGIIRFNRKGEFNVPYGHKNNRFSKAYITKIVNQVKYIENMMQECNWQFICQSFEETIKNAPKNSFIYCDPPYIGRHVDYYDSWCEDDENKLKDVLYKSNNKFMLSTWDHNEYRKNEYLEKIWCNCNKIDVEHFYHVGAKEKNRKPMIEALLTNYEVNGENNLIENVNEQLKIFSFV